MNSAKCHRKIIMYEFIAKKKLQISIYFMLKVARPRQKKTDSKSFNYLRI